MNQQKSNFIHPCNKKTWTNKTRPLRDHPSLPIQVAMLPNRLGSSGSLDASPWRPTERWGNHPTIPHPLWNDHHIRHVKLGAIQGRCPGVPFFFGAIHHGIVRVQKKTIYIYACAYIQIHKKQRWPVFLNHLPWHQVFNNKKGSKIKRLISFDEKPCDIPFDFGSLEYDTISIKTYKSLM